MYCFYAGGCKHSLLLLFWLAKKSSEPSSTSIECYWNKPSLSSARVEHVLSKDIFPKTKKPRLVPKNNSVLLDFQEECKSKNIKNSLIVNFGGLYKNSMNIFDMMLVFLEEQSIHEFDNFKIYLERALTKKIIDEINGKTEAQANCKYWHSIRQGRLTASKLHEAAHCKTEGSLVEQILGGYKVPETKAIQRGKRLEQRVLVELERKLGVTIKRSGFVLINGILGASPDGVGDDFVVEIKCPSTEKAIKSYVKNDVVQSKCKTQIQCQMLACQKKRGLLCVADPLFETTKNIHIIWMDFDEGYIMDIIKNAEVFWKLFIFPKLLASATNH